MNTFKTIKVGLGTQFGIGCKCNLAVTGEFRVRLGSCFGFFAPSSLRERVGERETISNSLHDFKMTTSHSFPTSISQR